MSSSFSFDQDPISGPMLDRFSDRVSDSGSAEVGYEEQPSVKHLLTKLGIDPDRLSSVLTDNIEILERHTKTIEDEVRTSVMAAHVFRHRQNEGRPVPETDRTAIKHGSIFADAGKAGPPDASVPQKVLIAQIFGNDTPITNPTILTVEEFVEQYVEGRSGVEVEMLLDIGVQPTMPIREFWNLHVRWTYELLQGSGVDPAVISAAASHHMLENLSPHGVWNYDGTVQSGELIGEREMYVMLLDKYDARLRRGGVDHAGAIEYLWSRVADNRVLDQMDEQGATHVRTQMMECITAIDVALKDVHLPTG